MEEKIIIKSESGSAKKAMLCIIGIGFLASIALTYLGNSVPMYFDTFITSFFCFFALFLVLSLVFYFATNNNNIFVTDKRVYGRGMWGKRVDIPLDSISSVGTAFPKAVSVASSSGRISFALVPNRDDIHKEITALLINRQKSLGKQEPQNSVVSQDNADDLRKYKVLLDDGVITQEEFDAKKKQILGM